MKELTENKMFRATVAIVALTVSSTATIAGGNIIGWWTISEWIPTACLLLVGGSAVGVMAFVLLLSVAWQPKEIQPDALARALSEALQRLTPEELAAVNQAMDKRHRNAASDVIPFHPLSHPPETEKQAPVPNVQGE